MCFPYFFFFKQKTAYEMRISDWSSDVCSSDLTGVGRQQHVIVSQGQIDAVLNARPEERRLILEEAAGVLKYRKRKEKAERRLAATEGNLPRPGDLLREVRRQLRPLERQAGAARRHARQRVVEGKSVAGRLELGRR